MIAQEHEIARASYAELIRQQLTMLGHDTRSDGLAETPQRVARFHLEHFNNTDDPIESAARHLKAFEAPTHGKVLIDGTATIQGEKVFVLKFLQARDPEWVGRVFFARFFPRRHGGRHQQAQCG